MWRARGMRDFQHTEPPDDLERLLSPVDDIKARASQAPRRQSTNREEAR